jgi:hypothetical protein
MKNSNVTIIHSQISAPFFMVRSKATDETRASERGVCAIENGNDKRAVCNSAHSLGWLSLALHLSLDLIQ